MRIIDKKPYEIPPNLFYGVNVADKKAVKKKYLKLKFQHFIVTIFVVALLSVMGVFIYDLLMVNYKDADPIFYKKINMDGGTLYKGLGYAKLYCDNGKTYNYLNKENKCISGNRSFNQVFYSAFRMYTFDNKIIDNNNLKSLKLTNITFDEYNSLGGSDYMVDVSYSCLDNTFKCFNVLKKQEDQFNYRLFVILNKNNKVEEIKLLKNSGEYYDNLVEDFGYKVENYLRENGYIVDDNFKSLTVQVLSTNGKLKYKGNEYYDSYLVKILFSCVDNSDTCLNRKDFSYEKFTNFDLLVLVDENMNVVMLANKAILNL